MQALMKLSKTKQIFSALDCTELFIQNTISLPAIQNTVVKSDIVPPNIPIYQLVFLNEHILGDLSHFVNIENTTLEQSNCETWHKERRFRLTASLFHKIIYTRSTYDDLCTDIKREQNRSLSHIPAVAHGSSMEAVVRNKLRHLYCNNTIRKCGLVINPNFPYLGASPDGLMMRNEPCLIEIKTVYNPKDFSLEELYTNRKDFCLCKNDEGKFEIRKSHKCYTQIQGQLGVCNLNTCLFVLHFSSNKDMFIAEITFDKDLWQTSLNKLTEFYFTYYLPYLCTIF